MSKAPTRAATLRYLGRLAKEVIAEAERDEARILVFESGHKYTVTSEDIEAAKNSAPAPETD